MTLSYWRNGSHLLVELYSLVRFSIDSRLLLKWKIIRKRANLSLKNNSTYSFLSFGKCLLFILLKVLEVLSYGLMISASSSVVKILSLMISLTHSECICFVLLDLLLGSISFCLNFCSLKITSISAVEIKLHWWGFELTTVVLWRLIVKDALQPELLLL